MFRYVCAICVVMMMLLVHGAAVAGDAPVVIKTLPVNGDQAVDPVLGEIRVTFSQDMFTQKSWSWVMESKETFPKIIGPVKFVDTRTCVAPVKLEPGKTYVVWFNSQKFKGFKSTAKVAATPYKLVFKTKGK